MSNVKQIKPCSNASEALRDIADMIDRGEISKEATIIAGSEIFHCGVYDDASAAQDAVWNMIYGISKLMLAANETQKP